LLLVRVNFAIGGDVKSYVDNDERTTASTTQKPKATSEGETKTSSSSGTGILISQSGHVLTNNHVVDGCKSLKVTQTGDIARSAQVLRTDPNNDLAVLKVAQTYDATDIAKFRIGRSVKAGETVAVYGYPLAGTLSVSGNIVSGNVTSLAGIADDVRFFQISAPVQPGNSGGPLLDASGAIIGVVNAQINEIAVAQVTGSIPQNVNFAIKASTAMTLLEANSIAFETSSDSATKPLTDIAEAAKRFSVLITCSSDSSQNNPPPVLSARPVKPQRSSFSSKSDQRFAATVLAAMRQKIESCWTVPAGAPEAERLLIKLEIKLNRDGTLAAYPILLNSSSHPSFETAARAAQAAVEACSPYDFLPPDKYAVWNDIIINFDPSQRLQRN
jgi:V8-like Glu-specific endopeptidase